MSLAFSTAPKARASDELYLEMTETRPYTLPGSAAFVTGKHDVYDKIGNTRFYQVPTLPGFGPSVLQQVRREESTKCKQKEERRKALVRASSTAVWYIVCVVWYCAGANSQPSDPVRR
jgi:hypothetical protein